MLDDLRSSANNSEEEEAPQQPAVTVAPKPRRPRGPFLGMTPIQRFTIAVMLFLMILLLGSFCLILSEKIVLPFF